MSAGLDVQLTGGSWRRDFTGPDLTLVPPLSDEFDPYGDQDGLERVQEWALARRLVLAKGPPACAHGLLMTYCPNLGELECCPGTDHPRIWVPWDSPDESFILAHLYRDEVPGSFGRYARAHGLDVKAGLPGDDWYAPGGALPVRLSPARTGVYPWPIGIRATVLKAAWPVEWPDDDEMAGAGRLIRAARANGGAA